MDDARILLNDENVYDGDVDSIEEKRKKTIIIIPIENCNVSIVFDCVLNLI